MGLANFIASLVYPGGVEVPSPPDVPVAAGDMVAYSLSTSNKWVDIYFDRPVYGEGLVPLTTSEFEITDFVAGGVTVISIASVKQPNHYLSASASALVGGESVIRFFLTLTGTADMTESFRIKPVADSVYDIDGNIMSDSKSTGTINLNIAPFTLWDAEISSTITTTGAGISSLVDVMGNVNLTQSTDADRPLSYLGRYVQFDRANTEFLVGGTNANFQKAQANNFAIVVKDLYVDMGANSGWIIAYFNGSNNHGWTLRAGTSGANTGIQLLHMDNVTPNQAVFLNFEDQRGTFIIQNESNVISIYDENNNRVGSQGTVTISTITWTGISLFVGRRETSVTNGLNGEWSKLSFYNQALSSPQRLKLLANLKKVKATTTGVLTRYLYPVVNGSTTSSYKDTMQVFLGGVAYRAGVYYIGYTGNAADGDIDRCFMAKLATETPFTAATKVLDSGEPKVIIGPSGINGTWNENEVFHRTLIYDPDESHFKHYVTGSQTGASPQYTIGLYTSTDGETCSEVGQIYTDGVNQIITIAVIRVASGNWKGIVTTGTTGATNNFSYDLVTSTDGEAWTKVGAISQFTNIILVFSITQIGDDIFIMCTADNRDSDTSAGSKVVMYKTDSTFTTYTYCGELINKLEPSERALGCVCLVPFSDRIVGFYTAFKNQNKTASNGGEAYIGIRMLKIEGGTLGQPGITNSYPTWVKFYWPLSEESATGNTFFEQIVGGSASFTTLQWTIDGLNKVDFLGTGLTFSPINIAPYVADLSFKMRVEIVLTGTINLFSIGTDIVVQLVSGNLRVALNNATKDYITTADIAKPTGITDPGNDVYIGFIWQGGTLKLCVGNNTNVAVTQTVNNAMTDIANGGSNVVICSGATIEAGRVWIGSGQTDQQWIDTDL